MLRDRLERTLAMGPGGRSLRIGIDSSRAFGDRPTGTENYSFHLIRALLALGRSHRYSLYVRGSTPTLELLSQAAAYKLVRPGRLWTQVGLSLEMLRTPPDVLFVPAHVLPLYRPRNTVVTVHDLGYLFYPRAHSRLSWLYLHLSTAFHCRAATRIVADSAATKRDLVTLYAADQTKIDVVHLAADENCRPIEDEAERHVMRGRYAGGRNYFLHLGTLQPRKNIAGLLDAYAMLREKLPGPPALVIAGKRGWHGDEIVRRASALGLSDNTFFVDYVPRNELPALLSAAVALVCPSFYEGFGLPALEAMACGTAVVASNCSSLPEVVGDAGLLVDPHDTVALAQAMERVAIEAGLREDLAAKGVSRARLFSWQRAAEETLSVIESAALR